jgi:uroporphyrinogen-III synthase
MKKSKLKILSTKKLNQEAIDKASLNDIEIDELPFITTEPIKDDELKSKLRGFLQQNITAVFTSKNAALAFDQIVNTELKWKIFCIGQATKKVAEKVFGAERIAGVADNAEDLSNVILQDEEIKKVYFFCGNQRRDELPNKLKAEGREVEEIIVYETIETPQKMSRKHYDGILFFSPSAVKSYFSLNKLNEEIPVFAVGKTTADAILKHGEREIITAEIPGQENLIEQVITHFSTTKTA